MDNPEIKYKQASIIKLPTINSSKSEAGYINSRCANNSKMSRDAIADLYEKRLELISKDPATYFANISNNINSANKQRVGVDFETTQAIRDDINDVYLFTIVLLILASTQKTQIIFRP